MSQHSEEYARGWRDGYGRGRDDEAAGEPLQPGPPSPEPRQQDAPPRDRQITEPRRNRG